MTGLHMIAGGRFRPRLLRLAAGTNVRVIVGAVAVGPAAGEWMGQLTLAVRARTPIEIRLATTQPLPSTPVIFSTLQALARLQGF